MGCAEPAESMNEFCTLCEELLERSDHAHAAYVHVGPMARAIHRLKYEHHPELSVGLGRRAAEACVDVLGVVDRVIPVPLHASRRIDRGYDQAALIAREVARAISVPLDLVSLERVRSTGQQVGRSREERLLAVRAAFSARRLDGARVLLVDDVITTGGDLRRGRVRVPRGRCGRRPAGRARVRSRMTDRRTLRHVGRLRSVLASMRLQLHHVVSLASGVLFTACHADPRVYDPLEYLSVGVEPVAEAEREERALEEHGFAITHRVDGRSFVALGAMAPRTHASAVRIITSRGIAMGIDTPLIDRPTWRSVVLLERESGHDLDGDGEVEVVVRVDDSLRPAPCLVVIRVRERGDAFEVPIDARAFGPRACPEETVDVERDGTFELVVGYRPYVVRNASIPTMPVVFAGHDGSFEPASAATMQSLADAAVPQRIEARNHARSERDAREVVRLSLEIAWLDGKRGLGLEARRAEFAEAIAGLELDEPTIELVEYANEHFE